MMFFFRVLFGHFCFQTVIIYRAHIVKSASSQIALLVDMRKRKGKKVSDY